MEAEFSRKICFDDIYIIVPIHPKGKSKRLRVYTLHNSKKQ